MRENIYPIVPTYLRELLLVLVAWLFWSTAWAQSTPTPTTDPANQLPPRFIPKSPTVSTLERFDSQQLVNLPTGAAQLAVPLTSLTCGQLQLPLSLAYSYTGLLVNQPKDLVGLGWTLQAGAVITRQVVGLVDEFYAYDQYRRYNPTVMWQNMNTPAYQKRLFENDTDQGPDIYSFSLPGGLLAGSYLSIPPLSCCQSSHLRYAVTEKGSN